MRVTTLKDKVTMMAAIIDPHHFTLWASYAEARMSEGKTFEEAMKMAKYNYQKDIELACDKAKLIIALLEN